MAKVISVEHLSKTYHLGQISTGTFSRDLEIWWAKLRRRPNPLLRIGENNHGNRDGEELWALKDVSFTMEQGEVLGIIGRNGAGKSTLLKILSRVTAPTSGRIRVKGRVASLLEVGTGFHPELTGRENIYLNGAILGMSRKEIRRKFDEIVDFAGVDKFIDTPVKRYSSGMYVRLAFAVAAHLEPEILLVDEVLAVGDAEFQKKCLGKMGEVAKAGRTVLFVSHNMMAIEGLCNTVSVFNEGRLTFSGERIEAIKYYMSAVSDYQSVTIYNSVKITQEVQFPCICKAYVMSNGVISKSGYKIGANLEFHVNCTSPYLISQPSLGIGINNAMGMRILTLHTRFNMGKEIPHHIKGDFQFICYLQDLALVPGNYQVKISLESGINTLEVLENAYEFSVIPSDFYLNAGKLGKGIILCRQQWEIEDL